MFPRDRVIVIPEEIQHRLRPVASRPRLCGRSWRLLCETHDHRRPILPPDCANAICWLAGDPSAKTTGHVIPVDGGLPKRFSAKRPLNCGGAADGHFTLLPLYSTPRFPRRDSGGVGAGAVGHTVEFGSAQTCCRMTNRRLEARYRLWAVGAAATVIAAALVLSIARRPVVLPDNPLANAQFTRLTDFEGSETGAAISPDGRWVAFVADRDGPFDIWLTQVGSGRFVNLTHGRERI